MGILPELDRILAGLGYRVDITGFLVLFGLVFARLVTVVAMAPFFGGRGTPGNLKAGAAAIFAAILYPSVTAGQAAVPQGVAALALVVKEALIGAILGLVAQLVFYAVQMAGILIDEQRGMNQFAFVAPQLPGNSSILGSLQFQASLVVFLAIDGHLFFIRALRDSFSALPLTAFPHMAAGGLGMAQLLARLSAETFVIALELSAPVMIALVLVDACFGAIARVAPQVHAHAESQPVKSLAGLAVLFLSLGFVMGRLLPALEGLLRQVHEVVRTLG